MLQTARHTTLSKLLRCDAVKLRNFWTSGTKTATTNDKIQTVDQFKVKIFENIAKEASWWDKNSELASLYKYHEASKLLRCDAVKLRNFWTSGTKTATTNDKIQTVDQFKVKIFENIAKEASWWDKNSELASLYKYHEASLPSLFEGIAKHYNRKDDTSTKYLQGLNILDIGCGAGIVSERLAKHGANVTGIDVCDYAIDRAIEHSKLDSDLAGKLHYQVSSIENFSTSNNDLYDVVISTHVMDYVNEPDYFLKLCCLKTKPGGVFIIEAKNRTIISYVTMMLWGTVISKQIPKGMFTWSKFNKPNEITKVLKENGFQNFKIVGHGFPLFFNADKLKLSDNLRTFYMVTAARK